MLMVLNLGEYHLKPTKKWTSVFLLCVVQLTSVIKQVTQKICIYIYNIHKHYVDLNGQAQLLKKSMCLLLSNMIACLLFFAYDLRCPNLNGTKKCEAYPLTRGPKFHQKRKEIETRLPLPQFFSGVRGLFFFGEGMTVGFGRIPFNRAIIPEVMTSLRTERFTPKGHGSKRKSHNSRRVGMMRASETDSYRQLVNL